MQLCVGVGRCVTSRLCRISVRSLLAGKKFVLNFFDDPVNVNLGVRPVVGILWVAD